MEEKLVEKPIIGEQEFKEYVENKIDSDFKNGVLHLHFFEAVSKFKSVRRAIRRGNVSPFGEVYPKRPFSNRGNYRNANELKKQIYGQLTGKTTSK